MNRALAIFTALIVQAVPLQSLALSSDRDQPMLIEADQAELDDAKGISTYRGNVKVTQGTLVLTGDVMAVHMQSGDVEKVVIDGKPATYRQRPDGKDKDVNAQSLRMEYFANPERIVLTKEAEVQQGGDILRSERIVYDVEKDHVSAGAVKPGSDNRVHITIQPRSKNQPEKSGKE